MKAEANDEDSKSIFTSSEHMFPAWTCVSGCSVSLHDNQWPGAWFPYTKMRIQVIWVNKRTNLGECYTHEGGSGTYKSAQELTRMDIKTVPHSVPPGDRTRCLWIRISMLYHWATSPEHTIFVPLGLFLHLTHLADLCSRIPWHSDDSRNGSPGQK